MEPQPDPIDPDAGEVPMCGRFILTSEGQLLRELFQLAETPELEPRYNIAPSTDVAVIRLKPDEDGERHLDLLRWGLVPFWADDPKIGNRMINARAETAAKKPAFRAAFSRRRCLIPADGFYEWKRVEKGPKQPFLIRLDSGEPFAMAGLWEHWEGSDGEVIESCTILTTDANDAVRPIHDRMPVLLDASGIEIWLDPNPSDRGRLQSALVPFPSEEMTAAKVSRAVNNVRNDGPELIEAV